MTTPVPEEVLAEIVANAHGYDPRAELARELLAARAVLRGYLNSPDIHGHADLDAKARACLPDQPGGG